MSSSNTITALLKEHKTLFIVITIGIILLEVEIFAFAAMKTGRKSIMEFRDPQGNLIHVTDGDNLSTFNKYYFEKTFGPMDQYRVNLISQDRPFPFRAWFTAALGIPVGAVQEMIPLVDIRRPRLAGSNLRHPDIPRCPRGGFRWDRRSQRDRSVSNSIRRSVPGKFAWRWLSWRQIASIAAVRFGEDCFSS